MVSSMTLQPPPLLVQPDDTQATLLSVTSAVAVLYSVTWIVVPDFPVGNGDCWVVGSAAPTGAVAHAVIASTAASPARTGVKVATCRRERAPAGATLLTGTQFESRTSHKIPTIWLARCDNRCHRRNQGRQYRRLQSRGIPT